MDLISTLLYIEDNEVEDRFDWYFNLCIEHDIKPTVKGFCNALRIAKTTLWNWKTGVFRAGTHEEVIVRAYDVLEQIHWAGLRSSIGIIHVIDLG